MTPPPLLHLDRNENLYGPAPRCFEVLKSIGTHELSMYSRDYTRGIKSRLSERLGQDMGILEQQILLADGSEDLIKQAIHCYVGPGEKVLCPEQSWWYYRSVAAEVGGETITYQLKQGEDSYYYDVDEMIALYDRESPRIVLIASPNNPTGNSFPIRELNRLTEAFRESIVILDEAYWGFVPDVREHARYLLGQYRNLLILRTFSKLYALAGARIGFALCGSSLNRLNKFASRYLGYNRVSEALGLAALDSSDYYSRVAGNILADRERYFAFFSGIPDARCFRSDANFLLIRLAPDVVEPLKQYLSREGIRIKYFDDGEFKNFIRITIGTEEQNTLLLEFLNLFFHGAPSQATR